MAQYQKTISIQGSWAKASEIESGITAKIVSETNPQPSQFLNKDGSIKTQDVAKVSFKGFPEAMNVSLNRTTINGLVDAFGEDSKNWMNKNLRVETEKVRVAGKAVVALYLIPEGYEKRDDESGYAVIAKIGSSDVDSIPVIEEDEVDIKNIPF
jgi:hypothetical protein